MPRSDPWSPPTPDGWADETHSWRPRPRVPAAVADPPDAGCTGPDVSAGVDSDRDGHPDTVFAEDGDDLLVHTDLDGDGRADQTVRIRGDATSDTEAPPCAGPPPTLLDLLVRLLGGSR